MNNNLSLILRRQEVRTSELLPILNFGSSRVDQIIQDTSQLEKIQSNVSYNLIKRVTVVDLQTYIRLIYSASYGIQNHIDEVGTFA